MALEAPSEVTLNARVQGNFAGSVVQYVLNQSDGVDKVEYECIVCSQTVINSS